MTGVLRVVRAAGGGWGEGGRRTTETRGRSGLVPRNREKERVGEGEGESYDRKVARRDRGGESAREREKCCVSPGQIRLGDVIKIGKMCLMNIHLCLDLRY